MNAVAIALKEWWHSLGLTRAGEELYNAARDGDPRWGKTEDVRRLLAEKAPLEGKYGVRHHPPQKHNPPPGTCALSVAKGGAERA